MVNSNNFDIREFLAKPPKVMLSWILLWSKSHGEKLSQVDKSGCLFLPLMTYQYQLIDLIFFFFFLIKAVYHVAEETWGGSSAYVSRNILWNVLNTSDNNHVSVWTYKSRLKPVFFQNFYNLYSFILFACE